MSGLPGQDVEAWWRLYARAHLRRPYERCGRLGSSWRGTLAPRRVASAVAFEIAHRLDAKSYAFLDRYPAPARFFDRVGVWLYRRGL